MIKLHQQKGFTLIEIIISIVIVGIVSSVVSLIVGNYLENYDAVSRRTIMQTSAQLAIERISREIRNALPNSICIPNATSTSCAPKIPPDKVSFIKIKDAGYYQDAAGVYPDGTTARQVLSVSPAAASTQFDIVSGIDLRVAANDYVAVYNINNATIYSKNNLAKITTAPQLMNVDGAAGDDIVRLTIDSTSFPLHSPQRRVHITEPYTTIFYLDGRDLKLAKSRNFDDGLFNPATADPNKIYLLLENVESLSFNFKVGSPQRAGLLHIDLTVEKEGERIHIIHEAHVYNVP
jgi:MSHA biogenesis protein MshO